MFTPNIRLNDDTGNGRQTEVALATGPDGLVLAGWMDERATRVCAFSFSTNGGMTWSKNVSIPNATGMFVGDPAVAIDGGGTMYAVCQEYLDVGNTGNIRMMTSTDKGVDLVGHPHHRQRARQAVGGRRRRPRARCSCRGWATRAASSARSIAA